MVGGRLEEEVEVVVGAVVDCLLDAAGLAVACELVVDLGLDLGLGLLDMTRGWSEGKGSKMRERPAHLREEGC